MRAIPWSRRAPASAAGADELCFLDITASHEARGTILDVVRRTAEVCFMPLTVSGGVRSVEDARALLCAGADKVAVEQRRPSLAPKSSRRSPRRWAASASSPSVDARRPPTGWKSSPMRGRKPTGIDAVDMPLALAHLGAGELLVTSMDRDGTRDGYDLELIRTIADRVTVPVVALGRRRQPPPSGRGDPRRPSSAVLAASIFHLGEASIADAHLRCSRRHSRMRFACLCLICGAPACGSRHGFQRMAIATDVG